MARLIMLAMLAATVYSWLLGGAITVHTIEEYRDGSMPGVTVALLTHLYAFPVTLIPRLTPTMATWVLVILVLSVLRDFIAFRGQQELAANSSLKATQSMQD